MHTESGSSRGSMLEGLICIYLLAGLGSAEPSSLVACLPAAAWYRGWRGAGGGGVRVDRWESGEGWGDSRK